MRVLVTGGAGFIGSHIVDALLQAGHETFALDDLSSGSRDNLPLRAKLYEGDIRDARRVAEVFREVEPQWVCHQAAQMSVSRSVRNPLFDAEVNIIGMLNVLDNSVQMGVQRLVFASSGGVLYGDVTKPAGEDYPADPISPYGITKWMGERYLQFYAREHGMHCVALRYANVYGPRQNPHGEAGVVAIFNTKMLGGEGATVNGDGKYLRDYVFVEDVAQANVAAMSREMPEKFRAYNIGTAIGTDVNELAQMVRERCQLELRRRLKETTVPAPQFGPPRAGDLRSSVVDASRAKQELGWKPSVDISQGLDRTTAFFANRLNS